MVEDLDHPIGSSHGVNDFKDTGDDNYEDHDRYLMKKIEEGNLLYNSQHQNIHDDGLEEDDDLEEDEDLIDDDPNVLRGKWTAVEDDLLKGAVKEYGGKNWRRIASRIEGRTDVQCLHRWQKVLRPGLIKGPWTKEVRSCYHNYYP
jgi:hypothetical protein